MGASCGAGDRPFLPATNRLTGPWLTLTWIEHLANWPEPPADTAYAGSKAILLSVSTIVRVNGVMSDLTVERISPMCRPRALGGAGHDFKFQVARRMPRPWPKAMPLLTSFAILSTCESLLAYGQSDTKAGPRSGGVG